MVKIKTNDLLKREKYIYIIHMLNAFFDIGLELKHLRYELIGEDSLNPDIAKSVNNYLEKRRYRYIHKIKRGYFNRYKNPVGSLEKAINILKNFNHQVIVKENGKYKLNSDSFYKKLIAGEDIKNIEENIEADNLKIIDDFCINLYGFPHSEINDIFPDHYEYFNKNLLDGCKKIFDGMKILQDTIMYVASLVKVNIWKKMLKILKNKEISLIDRQVLMIFNIWFMLSPFITSKFFVKCFNIGKSLKDLDEEWSNSYTLSKNGMINHTVKRLTITNPGNILITGIKKMNPQKKEGEIYLILKNHELDEDVSYIIISFIMLRYLPESLGKLCVVSYPPAFSFLDSIELFSEMMEVALSDDMIVLENDEHYQKEKLESKVRNLKNREEWGEFAKELFFSDNNFKEPIKSHRKKKLLSRFKYAENEEKILKNIIKNDPEATTELLSLVDYYVNYNEDEIIKILAPKE